MKKKKTIEETIENAKKQIEERKYEEDLQERGYTNITKMVFAFKGKKSKNTSNIINKRCKLYNNIKCFH